MLCKKNKGSSLIPCHKGDFEELECPILEPKIDTFEEQNSTSFLRGGGGGVIKTVHSTTPVGDIGRACSINLVSLFVFIWNVKVIRDDQLCRHGLSIEIKYSLLLLAVLC